MKKIYFVILLLVLSLSSKAQNEITKTLSNSSVENTVNKLTAILKDKGLTIFSVVDHQTGAQSVSMDLLPTTLIIFGNPTAGTKLMACDQAVGIDLPMKYLVWQDVEGSTWIGYWEPSLLANKYNLEACKPVLTKMDGALAKFATLAAE